MHISTPIEVELEVPTAEKGRWQNIENTLLSAKNKQANNEIKDHFVQRNGVEFAGTHLLLDLYDASHLDNIAQSNQCGIWLPRVALLYCIYICIISRPVVVCRG
ncbi:MAG: hypothetical protein QNK15_08795 [Cycloclasticus sp.]|nr:hypothetical protein [Cycloclasticus sp.]